MPGPYAEPFQGRGIASPVALECANPKDLAERYKLEAENGSFLHAYFTVLPPKSVGRVKGRLAKESYRTLEDKHTSKRRPP